MPFQEHQRVWERPSRPGFGAPPGTPAWEVRPWKPLATYWLLGIMGGTFVVQLILQAVLESRFASGASVGLFWQGRPLDYHSFLFTVSTDWPVRPWSPVTSTFSHGGFFHIFLNGLMLFFVGPHVERLLGRKRYVALFLVAGAISGILQAHLSAWWVQGELWAPYVGALGASGALMAVFGVLMLLTPHMRMTFFLVFIPITLQVWLVGVVFALIDLSGALGKPDGIGHFAHLSGMALGLAYGYWAKTDLKRRGLRVVDPGAPPESPWMRR